VPQAAIEQPFLAHRGLRVGKSGVCQSKVEFAAGGLRHVRHHHPDLEQPQIDRFQPRRIQHGFAVALLLSDVTGRYAAG
jgi:hypothetical protein